MTGIIHSYMGDDYRGLEESESKITLPNISTDINVTSYSGEISGSNSGSKSKKYYACTIEGCNAKYEKPSRLNVHISKHYNLNMRDFKCKVNGCTKNYATKSHLIRHVKTAHEKYELKTYTCQVCGKCYVSKQNLDRHSKTHERIYYECEFCYLKFPKQHMLTAHKYEHTSVKGFRCDICSETFITLREKVRHVGRHRKHECDSCGETFMQWGALKEHKRNSHTERNFMCDHCCKCFNEREKILKHLKLHETEKKFFFLCPLPLCSKFYSTKYNLVHHIRSAHLGHTYNCTLCDAKLSTQAKLKLHMKMHTSPTPIVKTVPKQRAPRKDKGIPKKSIACQIAGIPSSPTFQ